MPEKSNPSQSQRSRSSAFLQRLCDTSFCKTSAIAATKIVLFFQRCCHVGKVEIATDTDAAAKKVSWARKTLCVYLFFLMWSLVTLIGTAASLKPDQSCLGPILSNVSSPCSLLLVRREELDDCGYRKYRLIEIGATSLGLHLGGADASAYIAQASGDVAGCRGVDASVDSGGVSGDITGKAKIYIPAEKDFSNLKTISSRDLRFAVVVVGFVLVKLLKFQGLLSKVASKVPEVTTELPKHIEVLTDLPVPFLYLFITQRDLDRSGLLKVLYYGTDFLLFTWAPNIATLPFSSIVPEDQYINTAQVEFDLDILLYMSVGFIVGFFCYVAVVCSDLTLKESKIVIRHRKNVGLKIVATLGRFVIIMFFVGALVMVWYVAAFHLNVIVGFSFEIVFKVSFRFGLLAWASMFRLGGSGPLLILLELGVTAQVGDPLQSRPRSPPIDRPIDRPPPPPPPPPPDKPIPEPSLASSCFFEEPPIPQTPCCPGPAEIIADVLYAEGLEVGDHMNHGCVDTVPVDPPNFLACCFPKSRPKSRPRNFHTAAHYHVGMEDEAQIGRSERPVDQLADVKIDLPPGYSQYTIESMFHR